MPLESARPDVSAGRVATVLNGLWSRVSVSMSVSRNKLAERGTPSDATMIDRSIWSMDQGVRQPVQFDNQPQPAA